MALSLVPAAVGNAVFDATGVRLRRVPFTPERVKTARRRDLTDPIRASLSSVCAPGILAAAEKPARAFLISFPSDNRGAAVASHLLTRDISQRTSPAPAFLKGSCRVRPSHLRATPEPAGQCRLERFFGFVTPERRETPILPTLKTVDDAPRGG
jgi:hypothetical protein